MESKLDLLFGAKKRSGRAMRVHRSDEKLTNVFVNVGYDSDPPLPVINIGNIVSQIKVINVTSSGNRNMIYCDLKMGIRAKYFSPNFAFT